MNLRTKLWLLIVGSTFAGIFLFFGLIWILGSFFNSGYTHEVLQQLGNSMVEELEEKQLEPEEVIALFNRYSEEHPLMSFEWFTAQGELIYSTNGRTQPYTYEEQMNRFLNMPSSLWEYGQEITLNFAWDQDGKRNFLMMTVPSDAMLSKQFFYYMRDKVDIIWFLLPLILFLATPYIFSVIFFSRLNRRIVKLNRAMSDVNPQKATITVDDHSNDEIGRLTRHFNLMSARITDQVSQLQQFEHTRQTLIANLSHDLRTPMTLIQGYAETLEAGLYRNEEEMKRYTDHILRRIRYMDQLLQKLLEITQLDMRQNHVYLERTNLPELLRRIAADYVYMLENLKVKFEIGIPEQSFYVKVDKHLLERAVRNLIENAIQYGSDGGFLGLSLEMDEKEYRISVLDHGPGIPENQQAFVFDRFYRGSESRDGEGIGIGLSIVNEVAVAHEGEVRMQSTPHKETKFSLILPKIVD